MPPVLRMNMISSILDGSKIELPMNDVKEFLSAVGPTASLIFAAWIFLSFLQQRYSTAYELYRQLIAEYRARSDDPQRRDTLRVQILEYKRRCEHMRRSTQIGVIAAILLILSIMFGGIATLVDIRWIFVVCVVCVPLGLGLVIVAAAFVLQENFRLQVIIDSEIADQRELRPPSRA
jgi:hypothetical protein